MRLVADGFEKELADTIVTAMWSVKVFPWKVDPRENLAEWRKLAEGPDARSATVTKLDFPFGVGGPRDLKISTPSPATALRRSLGLIAQTTVKLPKGRWRFRTSSDDGVRVLVSGKPVIENWTQHSTANDGVFDQRRRQCSIVVEYLEIDGFATLRLDIRPAAVIVPIAGPDAEFRGLNPILPSRTTRIG